MNTKKKSSFYLEQETVKEMKVKAAKLDLSFPSEFFEFLYQYWKGEFKMRIEKSELYGDIMGDIMEELGGMAFDGKIPSFDDHGVAKKDKFAEVEHIYIDLIAKHEVVANVYIENYGEYAEVEINF